MANYVEPEISRAVVQVLHRNGIEVLFPRQRCCGFPQLLNGDFRTALNRMRFNMRSLLESGCPVVTACTTCALALKEEYPRLLQDSEAKVLAGRTYDICEFLSQIKAPGPPLPISLPLHVLYHVPCHLKAQDRGKVTLWLRLLRRVPQLRVELVERGCCGMGGTFGMRRDGFELSLKIGEALFQAIKESAPDLVATDCPACRLQIEQVTGFKVTHPILLLAQSYSP